MVDKMPVFTILAKDKLALRTLAAYHLFCIEVGLMDQAIEVALAMREMHLWKEANPDLMKMPDHKHVPTD